ncbi:MAG: DUF6110 family protein [Eubacteriales bacterium]|jgi:phage shock protein A
MSSWKSFRMVVYGFLAGKAGVAIFSSQDMKKAYTHITAAVKRGGSSVAKTFTTLKENCEDINADANAINEKRAKDARAREVADAGVIPEAMMTALRRVKGGAV